MARVTSDEVKEIIEVSSEVTDLTPFITAANLMVTDYLDGVHSDELLKEIERWLAAHFVSIRDNRRASEKADDVAESYQYKLGLGLESSMYGQQAMRMDSSGKLTTANKSGGKKSAIVQAMSST